MKKEAVRLKIYGQVQGVGYRSFAIRKAHELSLVGFVKNLLDGAVYIYAEGERDLLERFISVLKKGPFLARVQKIEVGWTPVVGKYNNFTARLR